MKKFLFVFLTILLTACSALAPAAQPSAQPTQVPPSAQVIIATVLVPQVQTVVVTQVVQATAAPTDIAAPTQTPLAALTAGGPLTVSDTLGGSFFTNMTYSADKMSLRCAVKTVTFTVKSPITQIVNVDFWYRIEDKIDGEISEWKLAGPMLADPQGGSFSLTFSAESIHEDLRRTRAWFDFQFVGLNKLNEAVGRSEKLVQLINYTNDCV